MKIEKEFDAVKMMRESRNRMSREMAGMVAKQQIEYIDKKAEGWIVSARKV